MNNPFFTVVIPTYNRSMLLKRAVDSVLNQAYTNFEIIVVDDHSTDNTAEVIDSYSDSRLKYMLNKRTKGACGARNTGIFAAKGKWVALLDDDDVWYADKLKFQFELISNSDQSVGLICTDYVIYKGENKKNEVIKNRPFGWVKEKILFGGLISCLSSACIRTNILIKIGGFDEYFPSSQDQDLYLRVAEVSEFAFVPQTLVYIYQEKRNRIGLNPDKKLLGRIMLRDKYFNLINSDIRLRCRFETYILIYAVICKKKYFVKKSIRWFLFGMIIDFPHSINLMKTGFHLFFIFRKKICCLPWS